MDSQIAIGKAASALRFRANNFDDVTPAAREELLRIAEALSDFEPRIAALQAAGDALAKRLALAAQAIEQIANRCSSDVTPALISMNQLINKELTAWEQAKEQTK